MSIFFGAVAFLDNTDRTRQRGEEYSIVALLKRAGRILPEYYTMLIALTICFPRVHVVSTCAWFQFFNLSMVTALAANRRQPT